MLTLNTMLLIKCSLDTAAYLPFGKVGFGLAETYQTTVHFLGSPSGKEVSGKFANGISN